MRRKAAHSTLLFLAVLFFTSIFMPQLASAADFEGTVKLEGEATFSLTASEMQLFDFENIAPGDIRTGKLHIENTTDTKMECRILSIMSYSEDNRLFDAMRLRITDKNGTTLYDGPYGNNDSKPLTVISVEPKKVRTLFAEVSFPADSGNVYQAAEMDSIWTFEARVFDAQSPSETGNKDDNKGEGNHKGDENSSPGSSNAPSSNKGNHSDGSKGDNNSKPGISEQGSGKAKKGGSGVKTGLDLTLSNSGFVVGLILIGLCFLASVVTGIRIYIAKHKRGNNR